MKLATAFLVLTLFFVSPPLYGQVSENYQLKELLFPAAGTGSLNDYFGFSLDVDGDVAVVGTPHYDEFQADSTQFGRGVVFVFQRQQEQWRQVARLVPSDSASIFSFGTSVAIHENVIVVGDPSGDNQENIRSGTAYVFVKPEEGWRDAVETHKLALTDVEAGIGFGSAVDVHSGTVVVGAPFQHRTNHYTAGAVYVYRVPASGTGEIADPAVLSPSNREQHGGFFGRSLAVYGNAVVIGSPYSPGSSGGEARAYVYHMPAGGWISATESAGLQYSGGGTQHIDFGKSVDIGETTIALAAEGKVLVYEQSGGYWQNGPETAVLRRSTSQGVIHEVGEKVRISGDVILSLSYDSKGLFAFVRPPSGWANGVESLYYRHEHSVYAGPAANLAFSGNTILIGNYGVSRGAFLQLDLAGPQLQVTEKGEIIPPSYSNVSGYSERFGTSLAIDGNFMVIGAPSVKYDPFNPSGQKVAAYIFEKRAEGWVKVAALSVATEGHSLLAKTVSISGDLVALGSFGSKAYVFKRPPGGWQDMSPTATVPIDLICIDGWFGQSVSLHRNTLLVGAPQQASNSCNGGGVVYVYDVANLNNITLTAVLSAPDPASGDKFGRAVAIAEGIIVVGAPQKDQFAGAAYLFEQQNGVWHSNLQPEKLDPARTTTGFGAAIAIKDSSIMVGTLGSEIAMAYKKQGTAWRTEAPEAVFTVSWGGRTVYGRGIALNGKRLVSYSANDFSAFIFEKRGDRWQDASETHSISMFDHNRYGFGEAVGLTDDEIVLGADGNHIMGSEAGAVLVYSAPAPERSDPQEPGDCVQVYPVPTDRELKVVLGSKLQGRATIVDVLGRPVAELVLAEGQNLLDLSPLPAALYIMRIETEACIVTKRIIKQ